MRNYLLVLNGIAINDFFTRGRAENAFQRRYENADREDIVELFDLRSGECIASCEWHNLYTNTK